MSFFYSKILIYNQFAIFYYAKNSLYSIIIKESKSMKNIEQQLSFINNKFENITLDKHFHEEYSFSLIYKGEHLYENEKNRFNLGLGTLQVVNPYELHSTKNSSWSYLNVMINSELINEIAKNLTQDSSIKNILFNPIINDKEAIKLFNLIFNLISSKNYNDIDIETYIIQFIEYILKYHTNEKLLSFANITCTKETINKAIEFMNEYDKKVEISLSDIALEVGITKYHLIKEFKKHIGITPNQYLQIKKVNLSKNLIKKNIPLSHVAFESGFTDQSYMIKVFKRYYGYTPSKLNSL